LKVNTEKSVFAIGQLEYLGYVITKEGIVPFLKKILVILDLERPKMKCNAHHLIGLVQYYRDLWEKRANILTLFSYLAIKSATKNGPIVRIDEFELVKESGCN
jgi:hypothetical protein